MYFFSPTGMHLCVCHPKQVIYCRFVVGVASAALLNAMMAVTMSMFPGKEATTMAVLETAFGLGYTIGELRCIELNFCFFIFFFFS